MAEPLSAALAIVKSTWQAVEFARNAVHAQNDAQNLWARIGDLSTFIKKIETVLRDHKKPFNEDIGQIVQKALAASNQTLDKLARRCLKLGDSDDLSLVHRITRPVYFTLSTKSIQKFEHELQMHIMVVQMAFFLLDRGENQEWTRKIESLMASLEAHVGQIAQHTSSPVSTVGGDGLEAATVITMSSRDISPTVQANLASEEDIPGSPLELLTAQETRAWGSLDPITSETTIESESTNTECIDAIIEAIANHSPGFRQVLASGVGLDGTDRQGRTPLMHTIFQHGSCCVDCLDCMKKLLERKVDTNECLNGETALHMAVKCNHLEAAKVLLQNDADIDASFPNTPLMLAMKGDRSAFVELFLSYRPNLNVADDNHWGLIHHATWRNNKEALLTLLKTSKALALDLNLDARCDMDWTPLMHLAENAQRPANVYLSQTLLEYGAEVDAMDKYGYSALYYAMTIGAASPQRNKFVQLLLDRGANIEAVRPKVSNRTMSRFVALRRQAGSATVTLPRHMSRPLQRL